MRRSILFAVVLAALLTPLAAQGQYIQDNKPDLFLAPFMGSWNGTPTGANPMNLEQAAVARWELNRRWMYLYIQERTHGKPLLTYTSATYVGYDPDAKHYDAYVLDSIGFTHFTGDAKGKSLVLTAAGANGRTERLTFTLESPMAFTRLHETSEDGKTFTTFMSTWAPESSS